MKINMFLILVVVALLVSMHFVYAITLTVNSPENDETYNSTSVLVSLEADEKSTFYYMKNDGTSRWLKLCAKTMECEKNVRVSEGENSYSFKAVDSNGESDYGDVTFKVDSKKPKILKTLPLMNSFVNGSLFSVIYTEAYLDNIKLFYLIAGDLDNEDDDGCVSGEKKQCDFDLDLEDDDGKLMDFWFELSDEVNSVKSKITRVKIDTTAPEIDEEHSSITADGTKVAFVLEVNEENFEKAVYDDTNDCGLKFKTSGLLCSKLTNGRCAVTKNFCKGHHTIKAIVIDKAGNSAEISESFDLP